jgi:hypothetical protein
MTAQQRDTTRGARFLLAAASILLCAALAATAIRGAQQEAPVGLESADMRKIDAVLARLHGIHSKPSHHHTEDAHDSDSDSSSDSLSDDDSSRKAQLHSHAVKHAQASKGESNALAVRAPPAACLPAELVRISALTCSSCRATCVNER